MASIKRVPYRFPRMGYGFRGENSREGATDEIFQAGYLALARNYHFVGRGRALKRQGTTIFGGVIVAGKAVQALHMYDWGDTRRLYAVCDGDLHRYTEGTSSWGGVTGSIALPSGKDNQARFTHFYDGNGPNLIGVAGGRPFRCPPAGNAEYLSTIAGPTAALDIEEFKGRLWAIEENGTVFRGDDGVSGTWDQIDGEKMNPSRASPGTAVVRHGDDALLLFYQRSIHYVLFDTSSAIGPWRIDDADLSVGCDYASSICHYKGITYFKGPDGFYRMKNPTKPAEYIGWPMEGVWQDLLYSRMPYMRCFARGEPYNEIVWVATTAGGTQHDRYFVFNTELETWSIFNSAYGNLDFNCGTNFRDSTGKDVTILGGYDGYASAAWGDDEYETGYLDGGETGSVVQSQIRTGMLNYGYPGIKRLKEIWIEAEVQTDKTFNLEVVGLSEDPIVSKDVDIAARAGARLSVDFILGASRLGGSNIPTQAKFRARARSRAFQQTLTEQNTTKPHTLHSITSWFLPRANRFDS